MFDPMFWKATAERAVKTFVQTMLALVGTDAMGVVSMDLLSQAVPVAASAALLSVLTSLASNGVGSTTGPSLVGEATHPKTVLVEVPVAVEKKAPAKKKAAPKK